MTTDKALLLMAKRIVNLSDSDLDIAMNGSLSYLPVALKLYHLIEKFPVDDTANMIYIEWNYRQEGVTR